VPWNSQKKKKHPGLLFFISNPVDHDLTTLHPGLLFFISNPVDHGMALTTLHPDNDNDNDNDNNNDNDNDNDEVIRVYSPYRLLWNRRTDVR
jgi:hypothetical protein